MSFLTIDQARCRKDGICGMVCPTRLIDAKNGEFPVEHAARPCIACGQCMAFCPHEAIRVNELGHAKPLNKDLLPAGASVDVLLQSRRSIRQYKQTPVSRETLQSILSTASYAPTGKNARNLRYVVLYEQAAMKALGDCIATCLKEDAHSASPAIQEGIVLSRAWFNGNDLLFRGAPHLIGCIAPADWFWHKEDSAINLTYIEVAAAAHGLGTCWAGYVTVAAARFAPVRELLGINETEVFCGGQMIGHPKLKQQSIPARAPYATNWL